MKYALKYLAVLVIGRPFIGILAAMLVIGMMYMDYKTAKNQAAIKKAI